MCIRDRAYFEYDSKKSYGIAKSHLRFSKSPIRSTYLIKAADFLACHSQSYITKYDMIHEIKDGGTFLLNTSWDAAELELHLPGDVKKYIADHNVQFYTGLLYTSSNSAARWRKLVAVLRRRGQRFI